MTISAAVSAEIAPYTADETTIDKACIDEGVDHEETYSLTYKTDVAKVAIRILRKLIVLTSESEGGLSLGYDVKGILTRIADIADENGLDESVTSFAKPKVKDKSTYW